jgi:hypothetical protein
MSGKNYRVIHSDTAYEMCLKVRHKLSKKTFERKVMYIQKYLGYGDFRSRRILNIEFNNFLMMT